MNMKIFLFTIFGLTVSLAMQSNDLFDYGRKRILDQAAYTLMTGLTEERYMACVKSALIEAERFVAELEIVRDQGFENIFKGIYDAAQESSHFSTKTPVRDSIFLGFLMEKMTIQALLTMISQNCNKDLDNNDDIEHVIQAFRRFIADAQQLTHQSNENI